VQAEVLRLPVAPVEAPAEPEPLEPPVSLEVRRLIDCHISEPRKRHRARKVYAAIAAQDGSEPLTNATISQRSGVPVRTVQRALADLLAARLIDRIPHYDHVGVEQAYGSEMRFAGYHTFVAHREEQAVSVRGAAGA
jgi:hypothetical protein